VQRALPEQSKQVSGFDLLRLEGARGARDAGELIGHLPATLATNVHVRPADLFPDQHYLVAIEVSGFTANGKRPSQQVKKHAKVTTNGKLLHSAPAANHWSDWIDFWAVDFAYESAGDGVFESQWQSYRTKRQRSLQSTSQEFPLATGRHRIAVQVIDVYGNETRAVVEVDVPGDAKPSRDLALELNPTTSP